MDNPMQIVPETLPPARRTPNFRLRIGRPEQLIEMALETFLRKGFERTSMEEIARQAGITKSAIFHHFGAKQVLLDQCIERHCLPEAMAGDLPAPEALSRALSQGRAGQVLDLVLMERRSLPDLGARYLQVLAGRLAGRAGIAGPEEARAIAARVVGTLSFHRLFGRPTPLVPAE